MAGRLRSPRAVSVALGMLVFALLAGMPASAAGTTGPTESAGAAERPAASERTLLIPDVGLYPRGIRLQHSGSANGRIIASVTTFTARGGEAAIFESVDEGASFNRIASLPVSQRNGQTGLCCGTLYELPRAVGDLPRGTLLYAGSVGQNAGPERRMDLDIWHSRDHGRTWTFLSTCASASNSGGLWEPEFSIAADGRLVCHYADETDALDGTQRLVRVASDEGITWSDRYYTVQSVPGAARPGMPIVRELSDGTYFMTFEVCARPGQYDCAVYSRTSADGWNWGDPTEHGDIITSTAGRYFAHAATVSRVDDGSRDGALLLVGQLLREADGSLAAGNGKTVFVQRNRRGHWTEIPAPVEVPDAYNNFCPNYSSSLVPLAGGRTFVELASDYAEDGICKTYFATGRISRG